MAAPEEPCPEVELTFKKDFKPQRVAPREMELLGSLYPELVAELLQTGEEE